MLGGHQGIVTSDRCGPMATYPPGAARSAGRTCSATSRPTPKVSPQSASSDRRAFRSARSSSGPGRSTSTPANGASYSAAFGCCAVSSSRPAPLRGQGTAPQVHARDGAQPAQGLVGALDLRRPPRRGADHNHAERGLRGAVIYRKLSLGSQSECGERRIERLLSASTTCRLQRRSLFEYLTDLLAAHARDDPVPLLA